jgi:GNAT superfamily N-acetyltransferase
MSDYRLRVATLDDVDVLVHHRIAMFQDMGVPLDAAAVDAAFRRWLLDMMPKGVYRAWVVDAGARVISGGGITILPWPPGPHYFSGRLAFVYNVYTEPPHRRQGLARLVMEAIHAWCRAEGIRIAALNSSPEGQPLYESMGYQVRPNPMMTLLIDD